MDQWGPLQRKHGPTGVPADHFQPWRTRHAAVDHRGRLTALVADGEPDHFAAVGVHHTDTSDASWDGPANEKNLPTGDDASEAKLKPAYGWQDPDGDATKKADYKFIHHEVASDGAIGAANTTACSTGVGVINGGRGGTKIPDSDKKGVYNHLVAHLKDSGVDHDDLPEYDPAATTDADSMARRAALVEALSAAAEGGAWAGYDPRIALDGYATWQLEHFAVDALEVDALEGLGMADHEAKTVTHTHEHSAMGDQGGDQRHSHAHTHSGDSSHNHAHDAAAEGEPRLKVTPVGPGELSEKIAELRARHKAQTPGTSRMTVRAFKRADQLPLDDDHPGDPAAGVEVELAVKLDEQTGTLVASAASGDYGMVAAGAEVPQIVDNPGAPWHAYLCVEGIRTDEWPSRELMPGGGQIPDLPVSMRFLVEDEGGHWGAITCGRIDTMERREVEGYQVFYAEGVFGTDENSQISQLHVEEQTQRFVSIDPRDVDCEIVEVEISVSTGGGMFDDVDVDNTVDAWVRYNSYVIGAATIVATPAIQQAVITMASEDLPWSAVAAERAPASPIIASAAADSDRAPAEWFDNPGFHVGDPRLVRQRDGKYACPLTLTDDGRVYGHVAYWGAKHTGFAQRDVTPPHSPTYAYFETGAYRTADGTEVPVGQITMGCGHASTSENYMAAKAHYDGGYGAVQMADVRAGEDDFGIWVAGSLRPTKSIDNPQGPTPDQVAQFRALGLSGDWRKIAGRAHFAAVLAVPVPGFPIAREALVASGAEEIDARAVRAGLDSEGEITSLVAAGRVHRLPPEEQLANLQHQVDTLLDERDERRQQEAKATALGRLRELTT